MVFKAAAGVPEERMDQLPYFTSHGETMVSSNVFPKFSQNDLSFPADTTGKAFTVMVVESSDEQPLYSAETYNTNVPPAGAVAFGSN